MSIYTPRTFVAPEEQAILHLIRDHSFATLITPGEPDPFISHLPFEYRPGPGPHGALLGHLARANPHWQHFGNGASIAIFHGPHTYVSPSWYADPAAAVPTWNYVVAHVHGVAELMPEVAETRALLDDLVSRYEGARARPWHLQLEGRPLEAMLGAIVGFRLTIDHIDAKFKLSQNRSIDDRERVINALREENHPDATATADWMESYARRD